MYSYTVSPLYREACPFHCAGPMGAAGSARARSHVCGHLDYNLDMNGLEYFIESCVRFRCVEVDTVRSRYCASWVSTFYRLAMSYFAATMSISFIGEKQLCVLQGGSGCIMQEALKRGIL